MTRTERRLALAATRNNLSPRELEVALLLCQGLTCAEAGKALKMSAKTAQFHRYKLGRKLDATSGAQLGVRMIERGYLKLDEKAVAAEQIRVATLQTIAGNPARFVENAVNNAVQNERKKPTPPKKPKLFNPIPDAEAVL